VPAVRIHSIMSIIIIRDNFFQFSCKVATLLSSPTLVKSQEFKYRQILLFIFTHPLWKYILAAVCKSILLCLLPSMR
jgi:hypothetical protein